MIYGIISIKFKKKAKFMITLFYKSDFETTFSVTTDCDATEKKLRLMYGEALSESPTVVKHEICISKESGIYRFSALDSSFLTSTPIQSLNKYLFDNASYSDRVFALHGAAVEKNGECHIFLASTGSGKTTLTSYLTSCGFGYLTDDCILLDRDNFTVHPCPAPIQLRDGGAEVLKRYGAFPDNTELLEEPPTLRRFAYTPKNCVSDPIPLKNIFFIKRSDNENKIINMPTTERMTALMQAPITPYPITGVYLRFISRLAKVNCQRLIYSDMDFVKELIENG